MPKPPPLRITDHALLRWLERAGLIDVEGVRVAIGNALERAFDAGASLESGKFLIVAHGLVYVVRGDAIVTVINDDKQPSHYARLMDPARAD